LEFHLAQIIKIKILPIKKDSIQKAALKESIFHKLDFIKRILNYNRYLKIFDPLQGLDSKCDFERKHFVQSTVE
jgi:hypothetical protein